MLEIHPQILILQLITFALGMGAIYMMYLKPLGKHLRGRKEGILKDLDAAKQAHAEAVALREELASERSRMAAEAKRLVEKTKKDVEILRADLMKKAKSEQEALLLAGRKQMELEKVEAIRRIREQTAEIVVEATAKLLEKNLNKSAQVKLAEKFVKSIKISKN
jgi:F-type H+-transporting ATPase subunit b